MGSVTCPYSNFKKEMEPAIDFDLVLVDRRTTKDLPD